MMSTGAYVITYSEDRRGMMMMVMANMKFLITTSNNIITVIITDHSQNGSSVLLSSSYWTGCEGFVMDGLMCGMAWKGKLLTTKGYKD